MHLRGTTFAAALLAASCGTPAPVAVPVPEVQLRSSVQDPLAVSLIQLIARPDDYDGEYVRVKGFYRYEHEGTALYLHREDYEHGVYSNGLWISLDAPEAGMTYQLVEGRFNAKNRGHEGLWSGAIESVTRMVPGPLPRRHAQADDPLPRAVWLPAGGRAGQAAPGILNSLRQRLDRVALARQRGERFDISDLEPTFVNVTPLVGLSRQALLDTLGAPTVNCRRTLDSLATKPPSLVAPCRAADDLAYSFYALPRGFGGGGPELLLEFDGGERCARARWFRTQ